MDTCPRCGKTLLNDHGEPFCILHGTIEIPLEDVKKEVEKMKVWDAKKDEILKLLETMSMAAAEREIGMPLNSLSTVIKRWKKDGIIPQDYEPPFRSKTVIKSVKNVSDLRLPSWNEAWGDQVKVAWLNAVAAGAGK